MKKIILYSVAMLCIALSGKAQLKYENLNGQNVLTFNGTPFYNDYGWGSIPFGTTWHSDNNIWLSAINNWHNPSEKASFEISFADNGYFVNLGTNTGEIYFLKQYYNTNSHGYSTINAGDYWAWLGNYYTYSDISAKTNIIPVRNALQTILALKPVTYQWIDREHLKYKKPSPLATNPKEIGFISQDIEQVLPDIISLDDNGQKYLNYQALIPILTGAIQELNARIEVLEKQLGIR